MWCIREDCEELRQHHNHNPEKWWGETEEKRGAARVKQTSKTESVDDVYHRHWSREGDSCLSKHQFVCLSSNNFLFAALVLFFDLIYVPLLDVNQGCLICLPVLGINLPLARLCHCACSLHKHRGDFLMGHELLRRVTHLPGSAQGFDEQLQSSTWQWQASRAFHGMTGGALLSCQHPKKHAANEQNTGLCLWTPSTSPTFLTDNRPVKPGDWRLDHLCWICLSLWRHCFPGI